MRCGQKRRLGMKAKRAGVVVGTSRRVINRELGSRHWRDFMVLREGICEKNSWNLRIEERWDCKAFEQITDPPRVYLRLKRHCFFKCYIQITPRTHSLQVVLQYTPKCDTLFSPIRLLPADSVAFLSYQTTRRLINMHLWNIILKMILSMSQSSQLRFYSVLSDHSELSLPNYNEQLPSCW